jgi:hypothetical protein
MVHGMCTVGNRPVKLHARPPQCAGLLLLLLRPLLSLFRAVQQLRELQADAVMGMALPGSDPTGDSCGCMLSHALGIDNVVVNGCPLLQAPLNVPQVRYVVHLS